MVDRPGPWNPVEGCFHIGSKRTVMTFISGPLKGFDGIRCTCPAAVSERPRGETRIQDGSKHIKQGPFHHPISHGRHSHPPKAAVLLGDLEVADPAGTPRTFSKAVRDTGYAIEHSILELPKCAAPGIVNVSSDTMPSTNECPLIANLGKKIIGMNAFHTVPPSRLLKSALRGARPLTRRDSFDGWRQSRSC